MKKKLAMRIASFALCIVFTGMLFGAPKSKAVVTETAIGTAAVASYFQATGLTMAASAGSTGALVTTGIADIAGSYAMATGAASSGSAFLSSLATGVSISPAGALVLTAAAVVSIGALVAWYVSENGLDDVGTSALIIQGTSDFYKYGDLTLPSILSVWNQTTYPYAVIYGSSSSAVVLFFQSYSRMDDFLIYAPSISYSCSDSLAWKYASSASDDRSLHTSANVCWTNFDWSYNGKDICLASNPVPVGDVSDQLEVVRAPEFTQPDIGLDSESEKQMIIDLGLSPGITLDNAVLEIPDQIAAGTLAPTYEITSTETGEGTDTETKPDEEAGIYIPILSDVLNVLNGLADAILGGIQSLFTPSQTAIDALSAEVDSKLPFIPTLQGFGDDLVYNLEHPEECADGLGLTTVVDLGKGRGTYLGNTKHELLDVSWYLEYKPLVDDIIVGFCWLVFLWNCYGALPKIIHGEGSITKAMSLIREEEGP